MATFGARSMEVYGSLHKDLRHVLGEAILEVDFSLLSGYRGEAEQNELVRRGLSKLEYPRSRHNTNPSYAVDFAPYPIDWHNLSRFYAIAFYIKGIAIARGIELRLGADWNGNFDPSDESFVDAGHLELV